MDLPLPRPTDPYPSPAHVLLGYLDHFRSAVVDTLRALPDEELRTSRLASGWTPLELLTHLTHVERRWMVWGFAGEPVEDPWGDRRDGRWSVPAGEGLDHLVDALRHQAARTRALVGAHRLTDRGRPVPRWPDAEPPTLERVLLHLVQEYARHAGHLDIVRELADGHPDR